MFTIPAPVREGVRLCAFLLVCYATVVGPPILVATYIGGTALQVWAIVVLAEFLCGLLVFVGEMTFDVRPRTGLGLGLGLLSALNFLALPLYVLLGS